jgi:hypothetical protein
MRKVSARLMLLPFAAGLAACNGSTIAPSPVRPPGPPPVSVPAAFQFRGSVADTAYRPLASATVEILDGAEAGTSVTTDANGNFLLPVTFSTARAIRASKENYLPLTQTWTPVAGPGTSPLSFYLSPVAPSVAVAGDYTLTLIADAACGFPDMLRTRTYELRTTPSAPSTNRPDDTLFTGVLSGAALVDVPTDFVSMSVAGDFLIVGLFGPEGGQAVERVAPDTYFAFNGGASGSADASSATFFSAPAKATLDVCVQSTPPGGPSYRCDGQLSRCSSEHHRLILVKR